MLTVLSIAPVGLLLYSSGCCSLADAKMAWGVVGCWHDLILRESVELEELLTCCFEANFHLILFYRQVLSLQQHYNVNLLLTPILEQ